MAPPAPKLAPLSTRADAVVCGGGPAGSTAAALLATAGRKVVLLERERFPRFHIGESLLPWNLPILERLGVLGKVEAAKMQVKRGARFYHQGTDCTRMVQFCRALDPRHPTAFQVKRAEFDEILLRHAQERGAEVHEGTKVEEALFDASGRATGVRVRRDGAEMAESIEAKVVVDATGRDALLSRTLGGRERDPRLERSAAFTHWSGFRREPGPTGGDIVVVTTPEGWWWLIPFADGSVSVGIVMPSRRFRERRGSVQELYDQCVSGCPEVKALLEGHAPTMEVQAIADYSYRTSRICGDGFVLVGDSAMFLDPVFSTGVLLAMSAGEMAADAIHAGLGARGRVDAADFRRFERRYRRAVHAYRRFVHGFYEPAFLETFYSKEPPDLIERSVVTMLAGDVFDPTWKARLLNVAFHACVMGYRAAQAVRGKGPFARATGLLAEPGPR